MMPIPWDWTYLIHRHLEGGLTEEQRRVLNEGLISDPRLRRLLAELAFEQAVWREAPGIGTPEVGVAGGAAAPLLKPAPQSSKRKGARRKPRRKKRGEDHDLN
jgi:hypothetical protein